MSDNYNEHDAIKSILRLRNEYASAISKKKFRKSTGVVSAGEMNPVLQRKNYVAISVCVFCAIVSVLLLSLSLLVHFDKIDTGNWNVMMFVSLSILSLLIGLYQLKRMRVI